MSLGLVSFSLISTLVLFIRFIESILIENQNDVNLVNANYTSCPPNDNTWMLHGDHLTLNKEKGRGKAKNVKLTVRDTPILYLPYITFPIDSRRQSGFLYPNIGSTSNSGLSFSLPYYWNIAPNMDATITPKLLSKRGIDLQNELRYLSKKSHGQLNFNF